MSYINGTNGKIKELIPRRFQCATCSHGRVAAAGEICGLCEIDGYSANAKGFPDGNGHSTQRINTLSVVSAESAVSYCVAESAVSTVSETVGESPNIVSEFMNAVFVASKQKPLPAVAARYYLPKVKVLIGLCAELQLAAGNKPTFFLSCRDAGDMIGVDFRLASKYLKRLELDGVLICVEKGSKGKHKANEYRMLISE